MRKRRELSCTPCQELPGSQPRLVALDRNACVIFAYGLLNTILRKEYPYSFKVKALITILQLNKTLHCAIQARLQLRALFTCAPLASAGALLSLGDLADLWLIFESKVLSLSHSMLAARFITLLILTESFSSEKGTLALAKHGDYKLDILSNRYLNRDKHYALSPSNLKQGSPL